VKTNWPNDLKIRCKPFSSLAKLIEIEAKFKKELNEFERTIEKDEILKYSLL
jgi:hypothetical protein